MKLREFAVGLWVSGGSQREYNLFHTGLTRFLARYVLPETDVTAQEKLRMNGSHRSSERRKWSRLPLAIPVFVRSRDGKGKEFLEFATALNVSAGGMLVAIRRSIPQMGQIRLEIPSAPIAMMAVPRTSRSLRAKPLRTTMADGYYLLGLQFSRPLMPGNLPQKKKAVSAL